MDDLTTIDDNISVRSESVGARSPPSLSPVVSVPSSGSPSSPPPLLTAPHQMATTGPSPPGGQHTPPMFPTSSPTSRPPPFLPSLYFSHSYASPPPIHTSDPSANDCKLVEYRGQKVAAFIINGDSMLCLPQAFELFLKNLVGGLHTVYTKLKRLGIEPMVCNVEQVRVLRGLGAIQPGVNRCKLLCIKHFDILYKDCTTARRRDRLSSLLHDRFENQVYFSSFSSSIDTDELRSITARPGRPPKRPHEILGMGGLSGPLPPGAIPPHLSPEALMALKKSRMEGRDFPHFINGGGNPMENELEKSPLLSNGYNPPPKALMAQYMALNGGLPHPALFAHSGLPIPPPSANPWPQHPQQEHPFKAAPHQDNLARSLVWENCRASYDEVLKHLERIREDRSRTDRALGLADRDDHMDRSSESPHKTNGYGDNDVLNLSKSESRDDLSDSGHAVAPSDRSPADHHEDKDDILSDNDDFDDKNDLSDRDDYDFQSRSLINSVSSGNTTNNNNNNNNAITSSPSISINKNLTESIRSHSNSSSNISTGGGGMAPTNAGGLMTGGDERIPPAGLNLGGSLMTLGMGLAAQGGIPPNPALPNGSANPLSGAVVGGGDRGGGVGGSGDGMVGGSIGSPSTASTPVGMSTPHPPLSSLENLLGNIQNLLKVAAESVRHEEKQWYREKEHLRIEFMRQKEIRERLEKQLAEDEKLKALYMRKLKREKRARRKLEEQLTEKLKRLSQYEPNSKEMMALRASECSWSLPDGDYRHPANFDPAHRWSHKSDCFSKESVQSAVAAAAAVASAVSAANAANNASSSSSPVTSASLQRGIANCTLPDTGPRLNSPKPQKDIESITTQAQTEAASMYFSKPMIFNCSV